jgi:Taurine catabolism dioxygenase TauD, TfdA family
MILFDESHASAWTISRSMALDMSERCPEGFYYGHLCELLRDELDQRSSRLPQFDIEKIKASKLLIVPINSLSTVSANTGGSPIYSHVEIDQLVQYVESGGALLVVGEYEYSIWKNNLNSLLEPFGIKFNNDTVVQPHPHKESILARHFSVVVESNHPIAEDIYDITYHRGCSLSLKEKAEPIVALRNGTVLCAVAEYGLGRVAAIGDSDLFSAPCIANKDNFRLFLNLTSWLCGEKIKQYEKSEVSTFQKGVPIREAVTLADLKTISGSHSYRFSGAETQIVAIANSLPNPYEKLEEFLREAEFSFHELEVGLRRSVIDFKRRGNAHGALLISGLPLDPGLPPTPYSQQPPKSKQTFFSEAWLAMIGQALGDPIAYSVHHDGEIFQNVCPIAKEEGVQSAHSSKVFLEWHTEQVFHPELPDFVVLLCLRGDRDGEAKTAVASVENILAEVPLRMRQFLYEPKFRAGIDYSFGGSSSGAGFGPLVSMLYGHAYDPFLKFDPDTMSPTDRNSYLVLQKMKTIVKQVYNYVKLEPGDLLIVDNRRSIHARSVFKPRYDGQDRWLQRIYVRRDQSTAEEERYRNERIIDTAFTVKE